MSRALPLARTGMPAGGGPLRVGLTALGCKVNYAEMAELAGRLAGLGCEVVPDDEPAQVRVLNSCAVTRQADATTRQRLRRLRSQDPHCHLIVTGCSVDANPERYLSRGAGGRPTVVGVDSVFAHSDKSLIADHIAGLVARAPIAAVGGRPAQPRGRAAGYHELVAVPAHQTRIGGMQQVAIIAVDHDRLRGVVLPRAGDGGG